jgi:chromosomal replication initiator protein
MMQPDATAMLRPSGSPQGEMLEELERLVGPQVVDHWFRGHASIDVSDGCVTVAVQNPFLLSWIKRQFHQAVNQAARLAVGDSAEVRFKSAMDPAAMDPATASPGAREESRTSRGEASASRGERTPCPGLALGAPLFSTGVVASNAESPIDKAANEKPPTQTSPIHKPPVHKPATHNLHSAAASASNPPGRPSASAHAGSATASGSGAGRRFADLSDFVKGSCNELALTAAAHVCEQPGSRYNPLVLYGGVGTGKTHLLEGIYRKLRVRHPLLHVLLISAEAFANFFTQALRDRSLPGFRHRFRTVDVLMIDDVDFLDGKRVIQEEFLHTLKQLESHGRQVMLSADRHPRLLTKLSEELVTRFIAGIVCRIESPDLQTRRTIVARRAQKSPTQISPEALEFVVQRFATSIRELEGATNCLETYGMMTGKPVGLSVARHVLADLVRDCMRIVRLADVEQTVCRFFGVGSEDLRSARRTRSVSQPRMLAMYLARKMTQAAYSEIGEYFGGRNHSTVMSAEKRILKMLAAQATVRVAAQSWKLGDVMSSLEQQLRCG